MRCPISVFFWTKSASWSPIRIISTVLVKASVRMWPAGHLGGRRYVRGLHGDGGTQQNRVVVEDLNVGGEGRRMFCAGAWRAGRAAELLKPRSGEKPWAAKSCSQSRGGRTLMWVGSLKSLGEEEKRMVSVTAARLAMAREASSGVRCSRTSMQATRS